MNLLSRSELKNLLEQKDDFLLINVLSPSAFQKTHIPGSKNVPVTDPEFVNQVENLLGDRDKNTLIVTYCAGFECDASKNAANLLLKLGYANVYVFEGGMEDWLDAGYPASAASIVSE